MKLAAILLFLISAVACAPGYQANNHITSSQSFNENVSRSEKGFVEFQRGLYKFVKDQNCVKCHGAIVNPMFAHADAATAYANAKTRVNFNDPASSKFISYAGNSHCADTPCSNPANSAVVRGLLESWAAAELGDQAAIDPTPTGQNKFVTASVSAPANIPTLMVATPGVIRFQLSQLKPAIPALANAILEIEIQMANTTTYRLNKPKIVGNTAPVQIDGIHVFVKPASAAGLGVEDQNQGLLWSQIAVTAPIIPRPVNLPIGPLSATALQTKAIQVAVQSSTDVFTIVLDNLR